VGATSGSWVDYLRLPLTGLLVVGLLALVLRWAFGRDQSLVERRSRSGAPDEYGALVPVATPATHAEGEIARRTLVDSGIRATLVDTVEGPRVMVFPEDARTARALLRGPV
jgi:hypothetical protein